MKINQLDWVWSHLGSALLGVLVRDREEERYALTARDTIPWVRAPNLIKTKGRKGGEGESG